MLIASNQHASVVVAENSSMDRRLDDHRKICSTNGIEVVSAICATWRVRRAKARSLELPLCQRVHVDRSNGEPT